MKNVNTIQIKKTARKASFYVLMLLLLNSCYSYTSVVGKGAQGDTKVVKNNTYFIHGLVKTNQSNPKEMADGAANYTIETKHTFLNGLLTAITFGIYAPTTTIVTK
ncbi:Bor family protein [Flavobacterium sp.]|uniref:Bor family protein n=1 Tax=Flavobacterium sp. TaxID=239 RepID=UPI00286E6312|nr:Bor family protein [Flavobacterium sp.]